MSTIWLNDAPDADSQGGDHLASCASCRAEADQVARLRQAMQALLQQDAPAEVGARLQQLTAATEGRSLECEETLELLESYRDGLLTPEISFLVDDHLLWCPSCAEALEAADELTGALRALPQLTPPESIAERIALARLPWWQRLWTAPAPSWGFGRLLQVGGAMAAAALLFGVMVHFHAQPGKPVASTNGVGHKPPVITKVAPKINAHQNVVNIGPFLPEGFALTGPPRSAEIGQATSITAAINDIHERQHPDTAPLPDADRMPTPMSKAIPLLAALRPETTIQPRSGPKDRPIEPMVSKLPDDSWHWDPMPKPEPPKVVVASAREMLLSMNRDDVLARSEEESSSVPDTFKLPAADASPYASRPTGPALLPVASTVEVNRSLAIDLKQNMAPPTPTPIVVKSVHAVSRNAGVPLARWGSDG